MIQELVPIIRALVYKEALLCRTDGACKEQRQEQQETPKEIEQQVVTEQPPPQQTAPDTTAPTSTEAPPAETATAPSAGANQQPSEVQLNWQQQLQLHLERWKRYPRTAQMRNQEGMPWIKFSMDRNGNVLSVELADSSGVDSLNKEALALVKRAEPLPLPPSDVEGEIITLTVPIEFFIRR